MCVLGEGGGAGRWGRVVVSLQREKEKITFLPVSDNHHLICLNYLLFKEVDKLEVFLVTNSLHGL